MKKKEILSILAGIISLGAISCSSEKSLALTDINPNSKTYGEVINLNDKGLVNLFTYWCGPCRREMPSLERLYQEGNQVFAVSRDANDVYDKTTWPEGSERSYQRTLDVLENVTFPIFGDLREKKSIDGYVMELHGFDPSDPVQAFPIPESFILDSKSDVKSYYEGQQDYSTLENALK